MQKAAIIFLLLVLTGISGYFVYNNLMTENTSESASVGKTETKTPQVGVKRGPKVNPGKVKKDPLEILSRENIIAYITAEYEKSVDAKVKGYKTNMQSMKSVVLGEYTDKYDEFLETEIFSKTDEDIKKEAEMMKGVSLERLLPKETMEMTVESSDFGDSIYAVKFKEGGSTMTTYFAVVDGDIQLFPNDFVWFVRNYDRNKAQREMTAVMNEVTSVYEKKQQIENIHIGAFWSTLGTEVHTSFTLADGVSKTDGYDIAYGVVRELKQKLNDGSLGEAVYDFGIGEYEYRVSIMHPENSEVQDNGEIHGESISSATKKADESYFNGWFGGSDLPEKFDPEAAKNQSTNGDDMTLEEAMDLFDDLSEALDSVAVDEPQLTQIEIKEPPKETTNQRRGGGTLTPIKAPDYNPPSE